MRKILFCTKKELRKVLWFGKGWLILLFSFLLYIGVCLTAKPNFKDFSFSPELYKRYTTQFGGEYSEETEKAIAAELQLQLEIEAEPLDVETMTSEEYLKQTEKRSIAKMKIEALRMITERYQTIKELKPYHAQLVYDLEMTEYCRQFQQDWIALIGIALLAVTVLFGDERCGMYQLLYSSKMGKGRVLKSKLLTISILALVISAIFAVTQVAIISSRWDLGDFTVPIQSMNGFDQCTLRITVEQCFVIGIVLKTLFTVVAVILLALISALFKNDIVSVSALTIFLLMGAMHIISGKALVVNISIYLAGIHAMMYGIITKNIFESMVFMALVTIAMAFGAYKLQMKSA